MCTVPDGLNSKVSPVASCHSLKDLAIVSSTSRLDRRSGTAPGYLKATVLRLKMLLMMMMVHMVLMKISMAMD